MDQANVGLTLGWGSTGVELHGGKVADNLIVPASTTTGHPRHTSSIDA